MKTFENLPAFKFATLFISGVILGSNYSLNPGLISVAIFLLLLVSCYLIIKRKQQTLILILTSTVIIAFGILKSNYDFFIIPENSILKINDTKKNSFAKLRGIIRSIPDYDSGKIRFILESDFIVQENDSAVVEGKVQVTVYENNFTQRKILPPDLNAGDEVIIKGKLSEANGERNPGEFNYKKYLALNYIYKIFTTTGYENIKVVSTGNLNFPEREILLPAKIFALKNIESNMKGDEAAYLKGLVTGERSDVSDEMKESFVNAGVMHIIAVSGLNVAYIIMSVTMLLSLFRIPQGTRIFLTILILIFYCAFTGNPASIVRATIMGIAFLISILTERKIIFYNVIGIAAMIILIYDSKQLFDAGFILSFTAVLSMAFFYNIFEKAIVKKIVDCNVKGKKILLRILVLFFTTLAAQLGTFPLTIFYFEKISLISLVANIIVVPFANLSLATGFFQIITGIFSDYLSTVIAAANYELLSLQIWFIDFCASFKFAYINVYSSNPFSITCIFAVIVFIVTIKNKSQIASRVIISVFLILLAKIQNSENQKLKVTFLDIGQGDCSLIQTPEGRSILIDCGMISNSFNSGKRTIGPYLNRNGIKKIDLLVITHLHNDHIGGINYLLEDFEIGKIIESGQVSENYLTEQMNELIIKKNIKREIVRYGDMIDEFENIRLYFLFPTDFFVDKRGETKDDNLNNGSVAFLFKYKGTGIFFSGDIEKEAEEFLNRNYGDFLKADILKVAHHGSITSSTIPFIVKNNPLHAVISCGRNNKFNHPSDIILNRLENAGAQIYRTDLLGAVIFESDGEEVEEVIWK